MLKTSITSNVLSIAYGLSKAATQIRAISSLDILPCIYIDIYKWLLVSNIHCYNIYRVFIASSADDITVILSPWSKMRSAPAGSSVNAHGLTIAYGSPLSRIKSSPYLKFTVRSFENKRIWEKEKGCFYFSQLDVLQNFHFPVGWKNKTQ